MAEIIFTFAVEGTLKKVSRVAAEEFSLAWGFRKELTKLGQSLSGVQAFLADVAHRPQGRPKEVEDWVKKLKDVADDADNVLDQIDYEFLRRKVELQNHIKKKVLNFFSLSNPILFRRQMARKIQKINKSLGELKSEASYIGLVLSNYQIKDDATPHGIRENRETTSFISKDERILGRKEDVSKIIASLINSSNQENLSVMAIVGVAGLGKTTLAKAVYNDPDVDTDFEKKIWVCVSDQFRVNSILNWMLGSLNPTTTGIEENQEALIQNLQKELTGKKYLLILDDVWNEEVHKWDLLIQSLSKLNSARGSTIILTTRLATVASITETLPRYNLEILPDDKCWSILKDRAFPNASAQIAEDLESIGREIAKKCAGIPLVANVLGSMLRSKSTTHEWRTIQESRIWNLPEGEKRIMSVLKLSFDNLKSPSLKQCFAYCSIYMKGFVIERENLIQLWMAQGLLDSSPNKSNQEIEDIGDEYFHILLENSLFQNATKDEFGIITSCKMHDLVHDLAEEVSKHEILTRVVNESDDTHEIRHVGRIPTSKLERMPKSSVRRLRSLFLSRDKVPNFLMFKAVRILNLNSADIEELPASIGKLRHLRYLDVSQTRIEALPESIGQLYKLQTLRMHNTFLKKFPKELENLINLRHVSFDCMECEEIPMLGHLPNLVSVEIEGMAKLKCLGVEFYGYNSVSDTTSTARNETRVLFPALKILTISNCPMLSELMPPEKVNVFPCLEKLSIKYCVELSSLSSGLEYYAPVLQVLKIDQCPNLRQLQTPVSLEESSISGLRNPKSIPSLHNHTSFRQLRISNCDGLTSLPSGLHGCTSLQELSIKSCGNLISVAEDISTLQSLSSLIIDDCDKLQDLPSGLNGCTSLQELSIKSCGNLISVAQNVSTLQSLFSLTIKNCGKLQDLPLGLDCLTRLDYMRIGMFWQELDSFPNFPVMPQLKNLEVYGWPKLKSLPQQIQHFTSLTSLRVDHFGGVEAFPEWLGSLTSLTRLEIMNCEHLMYLPEAMERLTKLEVLLIRRCFPLEERCTKGSGPEWHKISHIPYINIPYINIPYINMVQTQSRPPNSTPPTKDASYSRASIVDLLSALRPSMRSLTIV